MLINLKNRPYGRIIRYVIVLLSVSLPLSIANCSGEKLASSWQDTDITIDGISDDWNPDMLKFNDDLKMVYGISNNNDVVRFIIRFADDRVARKMDMNGFIIWLDKDKRKGIRYVDEAIRDQMYDRLLQGPTGPDAFRGRPQEGMKSMLAGQFFLIDGEEESEIRRLPGSGIRASASVSNGHYCMEYEVPRSLLSNKTAFGAGLEISGIDESVKEAFEKRRSDRRGGERPRPEDGIGMDGPQGRPGGVRGGGMRGGMRSDNRQANLRSDFEKQELWIRIELAGKPE